MVPGEQGAETSHLDACVCEKFCLVEIIHLTRKLYKYYNKKSWLAQTVRRTCATGTRDCSPDFCFCVANTCFSSTLVFLCTQEFVPGLYGYIFSLRKYIHGMGSHLEHLQAFLLGDFPLTLLEVIPLFHRWETWYRNNKFIIYKCFKTQ